MWATLNFGWICEGFYFILNKNSPKAWPSSPENPFSDISHADHNDVKLNFQGTTDRLVLKEEVKREENYDPVFIPVFPV